MEAIIYLILFILGYFIFRLIFNLVLPVMRTVRVVRREFAHQQAEMKSPTQPRPGPSPKAPNWDKMGDYIDFEEVK